MYKIYRLEKNAETKYEEVCYSCAKKKMKEGFEVVYNLTLSERVPNSKVEDLECELCDGSFFLDGRKRFERIHDSFSLC